MSILFTISKPPALGLLESCQSIIEGSDALLLLEDGVYYSLREDLICPLGRIPIYCLEEDLLARGLAEKTFELIQQVNYERFVKLCTEYSKVVSWF
ncbi:MAG: sulfurtransferase complex subunit TusB [Gammaproteobacteria bacterium]|nr:sulfurtransferase complex subunit TusB [Gammaproteobacteria bacterium]